MTQTSFNGTTAGAGQNFAPIAPPGLTRRPLQVNPPVDSQPLSGVDGADGVPGPDGAPVRPMRPLGTYPPPMNPMHVQPPSSYLTEPMAMDPFFDPSAFVNVSPNGALADFQEFINSGQHLPQPPPVASTPPVDSMPAFEPDIFTAGTVDTASTPGGPHYGLRKSITPRKDLRDGEGCATVRATHEMRERRVANAQPMLTAEEQQQVDKTLDGLTAEDLVFSPSDDEDLFAAPHVSDGELPAPPPIPASVDDNDDDDDDGDDNGGDDDQFAQGRLTAGEEQALSEHATSIYAQIHEIAYELRRKPDLIINRINQLTGSKLATSKSLWNYYQSFFARNKEQEHARLGTPLHLKPTRQHLNAFIHDFTREVGPKWTEYLILDYEMHHVEDNTTVGEAERSFRSLASNISSLLDDYERRHHIQAMVIMCGSSVNQDQANGRIYTTGALKDFAEKRLFMTEGELLAHAKTHSFDAFSMVHAKQAAAKRAGVAKDDDDDNDDEHLPAGPLRTTVGISRAKFLALVEASTSTLSKTDIVEFLSMSDQEAEKATREPSRRYMKACVWWHMELMGVSEQAKKMSFQDAPKTFAEEGLALLGWPSSVMYPPASHQAAIEKFNIVAGKKNHHQGIRSYDCVPVREVLQGFRAGIIGLVRRPVEDLLASRVPVFEDHFPEDDSSDIQPRRLFVDGRMEIFEPSKPSIPAAPSKSAQSSKEVVSSKAPTTRSRAKRAQPVPSAATKAVPAASAATIATAKATKATKSKQTVVEVESSDGGDDGLPTKAPTKAVPAASTGAVATTKATTRATRKSAKGKKSAIEVEDSFDDSDMFLPDSPPTNAPTEAVTTTKAPTKAVATTKAPTKAVAATKAPTKAVATTKATKKGAKGKQKVVELEDSFDDSDMYRPDTPPANNDREIEEEIDQLLPSSPSPQRPRAVTVKAPAKPIAKPAVTVKAPAKPIANSAAENGNPHTTSTATVAVGSHALKRKSDNALDGQEAMYRLDDGAFARRAQAQKPTQGSAFGAPRQPVPAPPASQAPAVQQQAPVAPKPAVQQQAPVAPKPAVQQQAPVAPKPAVQQQAPVAPKPAVQQQAPVAPRPTVQQAPVAQKPTVQQRAPVVQRPAVQQQAPIVQRPAVQQQAPIVQRQVVHEQGSAAQNQVAQQQAAASGSVQVDRRAWEEYLAFRAARDAAQQGAGSG